MWCHACGSEIELGAGEALGFREVCERCRADLHVCRNCSHHDPSAYNACREPQAERVLDVDRANRCDYFRPGEARPSEAGSERSAALGELERLFRKE